MPLVLKSAVTTSPAGDELYIEVREATGDYSVENPGGFGSPNSARNTQALIFYGNHKNSTADQEVVPVIYDALTVASFTILMEAAINGHLEFYVWSVNIFDDLGVYADGDVVYDVENPAEPFIKKREAGIWVEKTPADLIDDAGVVQLLNNAFPISQAIEYRNLLNAQRLDKLRDKVNEDCGEEEYQDLRDQYDYVDSLLENAIADFCAGSYNEAELKIEELFTYKAKVEAQNG